MSPQDGEIALTKAIMRNIEDTSGLTFHFRPTWLSITGRTAGIIAVVGFAMMVVYHSAG